MGRSSLDTHGDHVCRVSVLVVILLLVSSLFVYCLGQKCSTSSWNKPVSPSCAVAKSEQSWRVIGQSNLTYKRLAATKASKVWFSYSHNCTLVSRAVIHSACQVCLVAFYCQVYTANDTYNSQIFANSLRRVICRTAGHTCKELFESTW